MYRSPWAAPWVKSDTGLPPERITDTPKSDSAMPSPLTSPVGARSTRPEYSATAEGTQATIMAARPAGTNFMPEKNSAL